MPGISGACSFCSVQHFKWCAVGARGLTLCIQPSLNFVQGVRRTKWIVEGSKMDFFLLFRGSALVDTVRSCFNAMTCSCPACLFEKVILHVSTGICNCTSLI